MVSTLLGQSLFLCVVLLPTVLGFCPKGCQCDDTRLRVVCSNTTLDVLPIALNTRIKQIQMSHNKIRIVDASFQVLVSSLENTAEKIII